MDEYLNSTLTALRSNNYSELTFVLGNESCDLDSAVSSLVYAVFLAWQHRQIQCKVCTADKRSSDVQSSIFVPLLNVARADFPLKTEVVSHFKENGVHADNLVYRDDLDLTQLVSTNKVKVVLVDHHTLAARDQFLAPYVVEIIDHRPIDRTGWSYKDDTRSTIETVGSCCTLVAQRIRDLSALMSRGLEFFIAFPACTNMLHSTIILDTVNFSKELDKATPHDREVVTFLETILNITDSEAERKSKLSRLSLAKSDVSALSAAQLLRKDVKLLGSVLVPSFPILVQEFLSKPQCVEALSEALTSGGCSAAVLLGMDYRSGMRRDAAVYCRREQDAQELGSFLESWSSPPLQLRPLPAPLSAPCRYYAQGNLTATRKQYMPALNQYLANKK